MANNVFSPSMTLAGMDYIAPSAVCIKPTLMQEKTQGVVGRHGSNDASQDAHSAAGAPQVVKITLQDCLACSGCVTTAETVLVNAQSREEVLKARAEAPQRPWLVTISEQSAASLAACVDTMSVDEAYRLVAGFVRTVLGGRSAEAGLATKRSDRANEASCVAGPSSQDAVMYVSDLRWASTLSALKTAEEYRKRREGQGGPLPLLVSACPGWVCYCEKQGGALLPHLCPVLSPQGLAGSLAKRLLGKELYHLSIQPCFDRKLEAARDGFAVTCASDAGEECDGGGGGGGRRRRGEREGGQKTVYYTDCVISTAELLAWMQETDPRLPWRGELDSVNDTVLAAVNGGPAVAATKEAGADTCADNPLGSVDATHGALLSPPRAPAPAAAVALWEGSGGYHRRVMAYMAAVTSAAGAESHAALTADDIHYEVKRNHNHQLATCAALPGQVFCVAYGFQQIQNVVRGLKKRLPAVRSYSFVELMACPDGCLNGGGQVRRAEELPSATLAATQQRFVEYMHPHVEQVEAPRLFSFAHMSSLADSLGPESWSCTFKDRQREFEQMLDQGNVHSLKCSCKHILARCMAYVMPRVHYKPTTMTEELLGFHGVRRLSYVLCGIYCGALMFKIMVAFMPRPPAIAPPVAAVWPDASDSPQHRTAPEDTRQPPAGQPIVWRRGALPPA